MIIEQFFKSTVYQGATKLEHVVAVRHQPPGAAPFNPDMADELVGGLDTTAANGIAAPTGAVVVEPGLVGAQVVGRLTDALPGRVVRGLHPLHAADDLAHLVLM